VVNLQWALGRAKADPEFVTVEPVVGWWRRVEVVEDNVLHLLMTW